MTLSTGAVLCRVCLCVFCNLPISPASEFVLQKRDQSLAQYPPSIAAAAACVVSLHGSPLPKTAEEYAEAAVRIHSVLFAFSGVLIFDCAPLRVCLSVPAPMLTALCVCVCRKPEDLSREVIQIQQREFALKEQNYTLSSR